MNFSSLGFEPVLPGIYRHSSAPAGKHGPSNAYYYDGILIDPTPEVGAGLAVDAIAVTHVQSEHIDGAAFYGDAKVWVPAGDEYLCEGPQAYRALITEWEAPWDWDTRGNFKGHLAGAANERPSSAPVKLAGALRDGEALDGLRVVATPGHGKNALTFLTHCDGRSVAFCGDLICGEGQLWNWFDCDWDYGLETGQKSVLASARRLLALQPDVLLPAHGEPIFDAQPALRLLIERLEAVMPSAKMRTAAEIAAKAPSVPFSPVNFEDNTNPIEGWRRLSPHLYQWKDGNCALLTSDEGAGLLVDDGLCHWLPLDQRAADHHKVMSDIKAALGLSSIEVVIPSHYHGDHIYNIPMLQADEPQLQIYCLDLVADVISHPENYNLEAPLPWYGTGIRTVPIHRVLRDGERFAWREYEFEIFVLGGQTYYHCGIAATIDGTPVVFAGDALAGWIEECEPILTYNDCEPSERGWALSIDKLIEREPQLLVCGHGCALREPMPLLKTKQSNWKERIAAYDRLNARANRHEFFSPF